MENVFCPVLIVHGEDDELIKPNQGEKLHMTAMNSKFVTLPEVNHYNMDWNKIKPHVLVFLKAVEVDLMKQMIEK